MSKSPLLAFASATLMACAPGNSVERPPETPVVSGRDSFESPDHVSQHGARVRFCESPVVEIPLPAAPTEASSHVTPGPIDLAIREFRVMAGKQTMEAFVTVVGDSLPSFMQQQAAASLVLTCKGKLENERMDVLTAGNAYRTALRRDNIRSCRRGCSDVTNAFSTYVRELRDVTLVYNRRFMNCIVKGLRDLEP